MRFVVFGFLFIGFYLLFGELRTLEYLSGWLKRTRSGINEAARQRSLADRQRLLSLQEKHSGWHACEKLLRYSGLRRHYPKLTAEWWIMGNMICMAGVFVYRLLFVVRGTAYVRVSLRLVEEDAQRNQ